MNVSTQNSELQEIFDTVLNGIRAQGGPSFRESAESEPMGPACFYRHPSLPRKCAAGHLIKDKFYSPNLEGGIVRHVSVNAALEASGVPFDLLSHVSLLQGIHDDEAKGAPTDCAFLQRWEQRMWKFALQFSLNYTTAAIN